MGVDFVSTLWEKQEEYMKKLRDSDSSYFSRFKSFENIFNYFEYGQAVVQIACGRFNQDLFLTIDRIGKGGKIILIDKDPKFIYERVLKILGRENLPLEREFYIKNQEGQRQLQKLFSKANIETYVKHLPPYPEQIKEVSIDHVMAIDAAFDLTCLGKNGQPPDTEGLVVETYKKLKKNGSFIVQGRVFGDIEGFRLCVRDASGKNKLNFVEERRLKFPPLGDYNAGYWARWVKEE